MPLDYVLIFLVFVKHTISLNITVYLSYMDISVGFFCQLPDFKSKESTGFFYEWSMILFLPLLLKEKKSNSFF